MVSGHKRPATRVEPFLDMLRVRSVAFSKIKSTTCFVADGSFAALCFDWQGLDDELVVLKQPLPNSVHARISKSQAKEFWNACMDAGKALDAGDLDKEWIIGPNAKLTLQEASATLFAMHGHYAVLEDPETGTKLRIPRPDIEPVGWGVRKANA